MENGGPTNHHRLIVLDPRQATHVAIERTRGVALPSVDTDDRHTAEVDHVTMPFCSVTALGRRCDAAYSTASRATESSNACTCSSCTAARRSSGVQRGRCSANSSATIAARSSYGLRRTASSTAVNGRRRGGTWAHAVGSNGYRAAGLGVPVRIRQLRAWASSCVLEVRCETATAYFKALPHSGRVEFAVTRWLSEAFPDVVPRVIACDAGRRWLLMQACAGVLLEGVPDITAWARAARRYRPVAGRLRSTRRCVASARVSSAWPRFARSRDDNARRRSRGAARR